MKNQTKWRELKTMRRVGRPPLGDQARQLIAIRVDTGVLEQFRKEARRRRVGYQTLINEALKQAIQTEAIEPVVRKTIREELRRA